MARAADEASGNHHIYWENDILYSEPKLLEAGAACVLVVPQSYWAFLLGLAHSTPLAGHLGHGKTLARLVTYFYWPQMRVPSDAFCRACPICQAIGKTRKRLKAPLIPLPVVGTPFERVYIDIIGPLDPKTAPGNRFILVLVGHATRYPEEIPLEDSDYTGCNQSSDVDISPCGIPKRVVSDRDTNLISTYMKSMWDACGVTYRFTTLYHPQSSGLVERFIKTLKSMITGLPQAVRRKWDVLLPSLLHAYRELPQKGVRYSPFELLYGYHVREPLSVVK
ncbi:hypothetical protein NDU88_006546 [Pleurodeles waltl]|uniref:Gypsy retrotransposon integrase-like protein 1 n=1 Tax=Pleurodeles waltl TaxID=8319 RepID=A0AAV7MG21_PLEWA|nr:hypothetical protein NDU88_006546 [Pleurodeles waltl]